MQGRYRRVLSRPGVARTVGPYLLARLPSSMLLLALLLFIRHTSGSFVAAGAVSAAFAVAVAVTAPVLGRLVDARGQTPVLVVSSIAHPLALIGILVAATGHLPGAVLLAAAALAGASLPPLSACMRALWPVLLVDSEERDAAFGLEAVVIEACELGGPLLVGGLTAVASPAVAMLASGALTCIGTLLFAAAPASRAGITGMGQTRRWRGPLAEPGVRWLLAVIGCSTAGLAAFEVSIAGFARAHGSVSSTGALLATWFAGSLAGGWWYGSRRWGAALPWQLVGLLALVAGGGLLPLLANGTWTMAALLLISGVAVAPAVAVQLSLMSQVAPERCRTEAFTWASTSNFLGIGAGSALAGWAVEAAGVRSGLLVAAGLAAATTVLAVAARYGLGLPRVDRAAAEDAHDLAIFDDLCAQRDDAMAELERVAAFKDELAAEVAHLRQRLAGRPTPDPLPAVPSPEVADLVRTGLARLDTKLADLVMLEERRAAVLHDLEQLRADLQASALPANVKSLPRQSHGL